MRGDDGGREGGREGRKEGGRATIETKVSNILDTPLWIMCIKRVRRSLDQLTRIRRPQPQEEKEGGREGGREGEKLCTYLGCVRPVQGNVY